MIITSTAWSLLETFYRLLTDIIFQVPIKQGKYIQSMKRQWTNKKPRLWSQDSRYIISVKIRKIFTSPTYKLQYIPRNMHTVFALLCFVVVIHWLIFPYLSGLLHWHCGNLTIAPVPAKQPWWIWINTSCEFIMNDYITTTKQSTTKPCAYFLGHTVLLSLTVITGLYMSFIPHKTTFTKYSLPPWI